MDGETETGFFALILQCKTNELCFAVPKKACEFRGSSRAQGLSPFFDITQMGLGDPKLFREYGLALTFTNTY